MNDDVMLRWNRLVTGACIGLWAVATFHLVYRVFLVGLSADQQRAIAEFASRPLATPADQLVVLVASSIGLGVLTVLSLLCYSYLQWRSARRRRLSLEGRRR